MLESESSSLLPPGIVQGLMLLVVVDVGRDES